MGFKMEEEERLYGTVDYLNALSSSLSEEEIKGLERDMICLLVQVRGEKR